MRFEILYVRWAAVILQHRLEFRYFYIFECINKFTTNCANEHCHQKWANKCFSCYTLNSHTRLDNEISVNEWMHTKVVAKRTDRRQSKIQYKEFKRSISVEMRKQKRRFKRVAKSNSMYSVYLSAKCLILKLHESADFWAVYSIHTTHDTLVYGQPKQSSN